MTILEVPQEKSCVGCKNFHTPAGDMPCVACVRLEEHREDYYQS